MDFLVVASEIIKQVYNGGLPLAVAARRYFADADLNSDEQRRIKGLLSCQMHHHYAIADVLKRANLEFSADLNPLLWLVVANGACYHQYPVEEVMTSAKKIFISAGVEFPESELLAIIEQSTNPQKLLSGDYDQESSEYLSLRYNTPVWLVKMWQKHLGQAVTIKLMAANQRRVQQTLRLNPMKNKTIDEICISDIDFVPGPTAQTLIYRARPNIKHHPLFRDKFIFQQRLAVSQVMAELEPKTMINCLIYEARPQAIYLDLAVFSGGELKIDMAVTSDRRRLDVVNTAASFGLKNVHSFVSKPSAMITHIRDEYDLVVVIPDSSSFDLIRTVPDFFVHFKQESMDELIFHQNEALRECSHFVAPGGKLLYVINTVSHKEGHGLTVEFLKQNREFNLRGEKQYLPFDRYNSTLYAALLERNTAVEQSNETQPL
ncbi:MAG: hypothetical protein RBR36_00415 [Bacilli bacterium]|nr:hypothetical protein [Bacilli bacterium]